MKRVLVISILCAGSLFTGVAQEYVANRKVFKEGPSSVNISPDGKLLLTGFGDGSFRILDPVTFQVLLEVEDAHNKAVTAMDMPPKMDFILTAGGKDIKIWNRSGKKIGLFAGHATTIWNADISSDGKHAVSTGFNKTFLLWDVYNGVVAEHMRGHGDVTLTACISPDNRLIASGSNDLTLKIWDLHSKQQVATLFGPTQEVFDVAFSPDNTLLAAASKEKSVRIYSVKEQKLVHIFKGHREAVREVAFSPNGRYIVSAAEDQMLILWDVVKKERIHLFLDNEGGLLDVVFHPDGKSFYSISVAGELTRWEMDPEIFVIRYYEEPYQQELSSDQVFEPRLNGESKKDHVLRMEEAEQKRAEIIDRYYKKYLHERDNL